jgi:hypothetical protein
MNALQNISAEEARKILLSQGVSEFQALIKKKRFAQAIRLLKSHWSYRAMLKAFPKTREYSFEEILLSYENTRRNLIQSGGQVDPDISLQYLIPKLQLLRMHGAELHRS